MTELVVTAGATRRVNSSQNITTNKPTPSFLQAGCPSCRPTNSGKALKVSVEILAKNKNGNDCSLNCSTIAQKLLKQICTKFDKKVAYCPREEPWDFGSNMDHIIFGLSLWLRVGGGTAILHMRRCVTMHLLTVTILSHQQPWQTYILYWVPFYCNVQLWQNI